MSVLVQQELLLTTLPSDPACVECLETAHETGDLPTNPSTLYEHYYHAKKTKQYQQTVAGMLAKADN